ncbi:hypothetical protein IPC57_09410 [Pseudomonas aeruginosa]|nr:hypothetical protein IPC57_09410 [Pseudomonas aeruginosa]
MLDDGGHGHRLLLVGVGAEGQGHAKGQGTEGQPFILIGLGGVPALCENSMRPRVASEQKVIGFEPNQRYVAN